MVQLSNLVLALAGIAAVSALPQPIRPLSARARNGVNASGRQRATPLAMTFQPGGLPGKTAADFARARGGGANVASFGRPGRGGGRGRGGNRGGAGNAGNGNAGNGNAGNGNAGNGNGGNGATTTSAAETTTDAAAVTSTSTSDPAQITGGNGGGANQAIGDQDTGIKDTIEGCRNTDGQTNCFTILANTKGSCFSIPRPLAGDVKFFVPAPNSTCTLFDNTNCDGNGEGPAVGQVNNSNMVAFACDAIAAADPAATATTTSDAAEATQTDAGNNNNNGNNNNGGNNNGNGNNGNNGQNNGNNGNNGNNNNNNGQNGNNGQNNGGNNNNNNNGNNNGNGGNNNAQPANGNVADFGSCPAPQIQFGKGLPGRNPNELAFAAVDLTAFPHDAALNIGVITDATCLDLINRCGLKNGSDGVQVCRRAQDAAAQATKGGAQADAFNAVIGFTTNFAAVTA